MKIQIENLRAQMRGVQLNAYQRRLALNEYYKLLDYVDELEQLSITDVSKSFCECSFVMIRRGCKADIKNIT